MMGRDDGARLVEGAVVRKRFGGLEPSEGRWGLLFCLMAAAQSGENVMKTNFSWEPLLVGLGRAC